LPGNKFAVDLYGLVGADFGSVDEAREARLIVERDTTGTFFEPAVDLPDAKRRKLNDQERADREQQPGGRTFVAIRIHIYSLRKGIAPAAMRTSPPDVRGPQPQQ
jgi:hypothetical protein